MVQRRLHLDLGIMEISPFNRDLPLFESIPVPFWEVTIARDMRQFSAPLGLTPNILGTPSVNLAASIVFGRTSFVGSVRRELGDVEFRNLRNYALGRVKNPRALGSVLAKFGGNQEVLDEIAAIVREPEKASSVRFIAALEGAAYRLVNFIRSVSVPCTCCGSNLICSSEFWWAKQPCDIGQPEAELVDRACMVAIATHYFIDLRIDARHRPPPGLRLLADATAHPYGNWLQSIATIFNSPALSFLAARAEADLTPETVLRYARGETLTPEAVDKLTANIRHAGAMKAAVIPARTLAFAIEFLRSATRSAEISDQVARQIVEARVDTLLNDICIVIQSLQKNHEHRLQAQHLT
jgi:hypothetical protein